MDSIKHQNALEKLGWVRRNNYPRESYTLMGSTEEYYITFYGGETLFSTSNSILPCPINESEMKAIMEIRENNKKKERKIDKMKTLEEKIEDLEYVLYDNYHLEEYMNRYYTPSEVRAFYQRAQDEYHALLKQRVVDGEIK